MASLSTTWLYQDRGLRSMVSAGCFFRSNCPVQLLQGNARTCFSGSFPKWQFKVGLNSFPKRSGLRRSVKCQNTKKDKDKDEDALEYVFVEQPPYHSYMDSTSGQMEPASGARASIPGRDYWPEGTADRVRAANAPEPIGESTGSPSSGKKPGSRRKKNKAAVAVAAAETPEMSDIFDDAVEAELINEGLEDSKDLSSEFVVYQTEPEEEELTGYALDKKLGLPHPFIDPKVKKPIEDPLTSEELWWNWRKPDKEQWSRWQRRRPDVETPSHFALKKALSPQSPIKGVRAIPLEQELFGEPIYLVCRKDSEPSWLTRHVFLKAMAETGQVKLYGDHPTLTETSLYRARRHLYKDERLQAESERLKEVGPVAYYSEWVKAWKRDTSREAVQKHFEDTGEDENTQLIEMFTHQTDREYRIMMGTDTRIRRDPLAMRMREDQIKQIWGGDPVYPTVNYIQDPDEVIDFRGPDFHEPTPNMLSYLKEHGKIISREDLDNILAKEKTEQLETTDIDEAMAQAVDIGENDDDGDGSETESSEEGEKITRNWSVLKSTPELRKTKEKPKKNGMSLDEAIDDSENITDFIMDFDEDE